MHTFSITIVYSTCYLSLLLTNTQNTIEKAIEKIHFGINLYAITVK